MYGELCYAAAYVHLFYVLTCVERYVDCSRHTSPHVKINNLHGSPFSFATVAL
jgi:hypothetical protein